jgi:hypothetical protein
MKVTIEHLKNKVTLERDTEDLGEGLGMAIELLQFLGLELKQEDSEGTIPEGSAVVTHMDGTIN